MDKKEVDEIIDWIKNYVTKYAKGVVVGMSGGKDSLVTAKLCAKALGEQNVLGVIMPNGEMKDYDDAENTCKILNIPYQVVNIREAYNATMSLTKQALDNMQVPLNSVSKINTAPRIRMTTLYAIAGSLNYLVANTSNLSEACVGYTTKWGDNVGDFSPIANYTKSEVCEIGDILELPKHLVHKLPCDGLSGHSDEDNLGITYDNLDSFIRTGKTNIDAEKIKKLYKISNHKRIGVIKYKNDRPNYLNQGD